MLTRPLDPVMGKSGMKAAAYPFSRLFLGIAGMIMVVAIIL